MQTQAHPFITQNFVDPYLVANDGEYSIVINKSQKIFVFQNSLLINEYKYTNQQPVTNFSLMTYEMPIAIFVNNTPQYLILEDNTFNPGRLPIFINAKFASLMSKQHAAIGDEHNVFNWDIPSNKCSLVFTSDSRILSLTSSPERVFVLTENSFVVVSENTAMLSMTQLTIPPNPKLAFSYDKRAFYIVGKDSIQPLLVDTHEITLRQQIQLPANCVDIAPIGYSGKTVFGVFKTDNNRQIIRVNTFGRSEWSSPIDFPNTMVFGTSFSFALAAGPQYLLIVHQMPELFAKITAPGADIIKAISTLGNVGEREIFDVFLLIFGLLTLGAKLQPGNPQCDRLVPLMLEELWRRQLFNQWSSLALKWPEHLSSQESARKIMEMINVKGIPLVPFAKILEASDNKKDAFLLYLKAKVARSVINLLPYASDCAQDHIADLVDIVREAIKKNDNETTNGIIRYFCDNDITIPPSKVISVSRFDWKFLDAYYHGFDRPPQEVIEAYITGLAVNNKSELMTFLSSGIKFDKSTIAQTLLRLGCMEEYAFLIKQVSLTSYIEFMIYKERWDEIINIIRYDKDLIAFTIKAVAHDAVYFQEFCKRLTDLNISYQDIVKEIPPNAPANNLADGMNILATETAVATHVLNSGVKISNDEVFNILKKRLAYYRNPKFVTL